MNAQVLDKVMAAFENEPRVNPHKNRYASSSGTGCSPWRAR